MDNKKTLAAALGIAAGFGAARLVDLALIGGSIATAASAVAFAGYMTLGGGDHPPLINGMEHLAIFAQPNHGVKHGDTTSVDASPVGALPPEVKAHVEGYSLVGAQKDFAWLREGNHIFSVHTGDTVPRLGRITSIEQRDGRWTLLDDKGNQLIAATKPDIPPPGTGRFDKPLIFGSGR